jgi:tetrapyrrole methylase family protein / MazG family protein
MVKIMPEIILLGLGPGDPRLLTVEAQSILNSTDEIYLRTRQHPAVVGFPDELEVHDFDELYENATSFEQVYEIIVARVLALGERSQGVIYAVPGHPFVAEATGPAIYRQARERNIPVRVVPGLSFFEPVIAAIGGDPLPHTSLVDALELEIGHYPPFPPSAPAIIAQLYSRQVASNVKLTLMAVYPDEHPVMLIHAAGTLDEAVEHLPLYGIDRSEQIGLLTSLYVPALGPDTSVEGFQEIVAHLRAPDGCPWDRKQTLQSLRPHLLEEVYEALDALDQNDTDALREELGDLLLMILMLAQIASEYGEFNFSQVVQGIHTKIVARHPHVFGDLELYDEAGVLENWERIKAAERVADGQADKGLLAGISRGMPALQTAQEYQSRAARVGFDWPDVSGVWDKIAEELREIQEAESPEERSSEMGDVLFSIVNLARRLDVDAEIALREANTRFRRRFGYVERTAHERGQVLSQMSLAQLDMLWEEAKQR